MHAVNVYYGRVIETKHSRAIQHDYQRITRLIVAITTGEFAPIQTNNFKQKLLCLGTDQTTKYANERRLWHMK